jgi:hypothetical protein
MRSAVTVLALGLLGPATQALAAPALQEPPAEETCVLTGDKLASPARVVLGDSVQIRLSLSADCPPATYRPADLFIVMDSSLSMQSDGKMTAAKNAAVAFVDRTDLATHRIGVIAFYGSTIERSGLSQDAQALRSAIQGIDTRQGTNIAAAVDAAQASLAANGRPEAHKVIMLITDGSPNLPSPDPKTAAVRSAATAKLAGTEIFTIGLGRDADANLLANVATDDDHYYFSPSGAELTQVYAAIAVLVTDSVIRNLVLADDLTSEVKLVDGTANPTATVSGDVLNWTADSLPSDGLTWVYQVTPQKVGTYPTNTRAAVTYRDADGENREFVFPVPTITVVSPRLDLLCDRPNGWTIMVHSFPDSVGVGPGARTGCNIIFNSGDATTGQRYPCRTWSTS